MPVTGPSWIAVSRQRGLFASPTMSTSQKWIMGGIRRGYSVATKSLSEMAFISVNDAMDAKSSKLFVTRW